MSDAAQKNVYGEPLECCCTDPMTGFMRNGNCETDVQDIGAHVICAKMTAEFLEFSKSRGNDLVTPHPEFGFPGLKPGDRWCLCAARWREALQAGVAPPVLIQGTHERALDYVDLADLKKHALDLM
ncbi:MAG: DUF2237 domain-containing protein [Xanthomonadales bacterium]|nr:DUF2237 domain-containing protein [Xanthomonadales bacterium]